MAKLKKLFTPRRPISKLSYIVLALSTFIVFLSAWSILTYTGIIKPLFLPSPSSIAKTTVELFTKFDLFLHIRVSIYRVFMGFILAAALGIPLGIFMGTYKIVEALAEPLNDFIRYMPVVAFIPLTILWIGIGDAQKIAIIFIGTFFQLVLLVSDSVSAVQNEFLETSYTLGISKWLTVWKVLVPASFPSIFNNLRVCMGWAWSYLVVAELVAASKGIGFMIIKSQRFLQTGNVISGIIIVGILGLIFDYIFKLAYNILFPWAQKRVA